MVSLSRLLAVLMVTWFLLPWQSYGMGGLSSGGKSEQGGLPVFPGAQGFGIFTAAGRGGKILKVTSLADSGPGSLRAAIEDTGRRIVIFEVSGRIDLQTDLVIEHPYLTLAGQTAPSPGIQVTGRMLSINTHDVLVQHLRIRVGDEGKDSNGQWDSTDAVQPYGSGCQRVILDHLTVNWSIDEIVGTGGGARDITISNSILSEPLMDSVHSKGAHGFILLMGRNTFNFSVINSLLSHGRARMPRVQTGSFLFANNFVYDSGSSAFVSLGVGETNSDGPIFLSAIGNQFKRGPSGTPAVAISCGDMTDGSSIYLADNVYSAGKVVNPNCGSSVVSSPPSTTWPAGFNPIGSSMVIHHVTTNAGARPADRDTVDKRIVENALEGTGGIIDSQRQVGGFPLYTKNIRAFAIPDNPHGDDNSNGYTNIEEVLFRMASEVERGW